jgi:2'-5' RNA ligase
MRAFVGLEPDATTKLAIENWRNKVLPPFNQLVPAANYHITLAFLGHINLDQQDRLEQHMQLIDNITEFKVHLDILGYWPKPKALWLGCSQPAKLHLDLVKILSSAAHSANIVMQKRDYQAHLTLVRKCTHNPPAPLLAPDFTWLAEAFHLYESVSTANGVSYVIKKTWRLPPAITARKCIS